MIENYWASQVRLIRFEEVSLFYADGVKDVKMILDFDKNIRTSINIHYPAEICPTIIKAA